MISPARLVTQKLFIQNTALAVLSNVGNPYTSDPTLVVLCATENFLPQRLIEFFREATCVSTNDGDVTSLGVGIVQRDVLLHCKL